MSEEGVTGTFFVIGEKARSIHLPGKNAVWFCGALNFHGEYGGFNDGYYRDELFEPLFDSLKVRFPSLVEEVDVISFFACHPCKVRTEQFWDFNYYHGENPDSSEWKTPELRPLESMKTARKNFRRLMQFLKNQDNIEITTFRSLMALYSQQKEFITAGELRIMAQKTIDEKTIMIDDYFSPAEVFAGLVKSIVEYEHEGSLPDRIKRISPLGPMEMPNMEPEISRVIVEQVYNLAQRADENISRYGALPSFLKVKNQRIGTGSLFALFSAVYLDINSGNVDTEYAVPSFDAYPKTNEKEIIEQVEGCRSWPVHRRDLDMGRLVETTRMQLWTLKPAQVM